VLCNSFACSGLEKLRCTDGSDTLKKGSDAASRRVLALRTSAHRSCYTPGTFSASLLEKNETNGRQCGDVTAATEGFPRCLNLRREDAA
jgi:hypothetical protein